MNIRQAIEKEARFLDSLELKSLRHAEAEGDLKMGSWYRRDLKRMSASYKRILKELDNE